MQVLCGVFRRVCVWRRIGGAHVQEWANEVCKCARVVCADRLQCVGPGRPLSKPSHAHGELSTPSAHVWERRPIFAARQQ